MRPLAPPGDRLLPPRPSPPYEPIGRPLVHWQAWPGEGGPAADTLGPREAQALVAEVARLGAPALLLGGIDPLLRPDLPDRIAEAAAAGLPTLLAPEGWPWWRHGGLLGARSAGLVGLRLRLHGSRREVHDRLTGEAGGFDGALEGAASALGLGVGLQIRTDLVPDNADHLAGIAELAAGLEAAWWDVRLPVEPPGGGQRLDATVAETALRWLLEAAPGLPFRVTVSEALHLHWIAAGLAPPEVPVEALPPETFIGHDGSVRPGPGLPAAGRGLREAGLGEIVRSDPGFLLARQRSRLGGRCGRCPYREACGGSRGRALGWWGDPLAEDPLCSFEPAPAGPE